MSPASRQAWRDALALTGAALLLRVIAACTAVALTKDGTIYARAAQAAAGGDALGWLLPTYPPFVAAIAAPFLAVGLGVEPWAGIAVALVSAPVAGLAYAVGREGWDRRVGIVAGAFAAAAPTLVRGGATLIATGPHAALVLAVLWCGARALRPGAALGWGWGAGVAAGCAYLARPEGLGAAIVVALAIGWMCWRPLGGVTRSRLGGQFAMGAVGLLAAALPYVVHASVVWGDFSISRKKRVAAVFASERIGLDLQAGDSAGSVVGRVPGAAWEAVRDSTTAWHLLLAALGVVALVACWRAAVDDAQRPMRRLLLLGAAAWCGLGFLLKFSLGYLAQSHVAPVGVALMPWSAAGALWMADRIAARWPARAAWAAPAVVSLVVVVLLAKSMVPMAGRRQAEVDLGRELGAQLPPDALIVSNLPRVSWYAGARARFIPIRFAPRTDAAHELAFVRGLGATALVLDAEDVERGQGGAGPTHPGLLPALEVGVDAELLLRTPTDAPDDYRVYRIRSGR